MGDDFKIIFDAENMRLVLLSGPDNHEIKEIDIESLTKVEINDNGLLEVYFTIDNEEQYELYDIDEETAKDLVRQFGELKNSNGNGKPETVNMEVKCPNDADNKERIAKEITHLINDNSYCEDELDNLKSTSASYRERIKQNNKKLQELSDDYNAEYINRGKECIIEKDYENAEIRFRDPDSGEIVETRKMSMDERQTRLELDYLKIKDEEPATDGYAENNLRNEKETWWEFFTDFLKDESHEVNVRQHLKDGITEKRTLKLHDEIMEDKRFENILVQCRAAKNDDDLNECTRLFYELVRGILIDKGAFAKK